MADTSVAVTNFLRRAMEAAQREESAMGLSDQGYRAQELVDA